jgi:DNA polymerase III alpha subunit (gram-positive type)
MKYLLFDTETTDLIANLLRPLPKQPKIFEFFGIVLEETEEEWIEHLRFHRMWNPGEELKPKVTEITKVTNEMLAGKPKITKKDVQELQQLFNSVDAIVAHNVTYDINVVTFEFLRQGESPIFPRAICTVEATEHFKGHRLRLADLYTYLFEETFEGAHRAEQDVDAMVRCFIELKNRGEI